MSQQTDIAYFERRAVEERKIAEHAEGGRYRIHIAFAEAYERRVQELVAAQSVPEDDRPR